MNSEYQTPPHPALKNIAFKGSAGECDGCCISFVLFEQIRSNRFCELTIFVSYLSIYYIVSNVTNSTSNRNSCSNVADSSFKFTL